MVKAREIRAETREQLMSRLAELRKELASLRVAQLTNGAPSRIAKIGGTRKDIARVLTVFHSNERIQAKKLLADKPMNQWPKDLRPKMTRAKRRALPQSLVSLNLPRLPTALLSGLIIQCLHHLSTDLFDVT
jgi:large subunit ribosomal protein L35e